jgi:hypothetical protein
MPPPDAIRTTEEHNGLEGIVFGKFMARVRFTPESGH